MKKKDLKVSLLSLNAPASWPSLGIIVSSFKKHLKSIFPNVKDYEVLSGNKAPVTDDLWIVPLGHTQPYIFSWLKKEFPSPYKRPRMLFVLSGEGVKGAYLLYYFKDLFRIDDEWLVASEGEKKILADFFPGNNRTHILHYPVESQFRAPTKDKKELRKKLGLPASKSLLLYAGRVSPQKNVLEILDVLEKFKDMHAIICGDSDSIGWPHFQDKNGLHMTTEFVREIAKRGLSSRIEFRGFLSQSDLREVMQACDYQISLSAHYGEDYGYSIAQGLSCGLKTILSHWGGHLNWKGFFKDSEVSYVPLEWKDGVGKPVLESLVLPKKKRVDFSVDFHRHFKKRLKEIALNNNFSDRKVHLSVSDELKNYWAELEQSKRAVMFKDAKDPIFQKVIEYYSR